MAKIIAFDSEARRGLDTATGNMTGPEASEVAVRHWVDQAPHAGARGKPVRGGVVVLRVHRDVSCGLPCPATPVTYQNDITLIDDLSRAGERASWSATGRA